MMEAGTPLLEVDHLTMRFGGLVAVDDLSFQARRQEITALIGPNGAGKTTVLNCLTGFYRPPTGRMQLHAGCPTPFLLERMETSRIVREAGVVRTFQKARLFSSMSVLENLIVAQHPRLMRGSGLSPASLIGLPRYRRAAREALDRGRHWLDRLDLAHAADRAAGALSYAMQRRLEIARAICARPRLLCLDEPAAGLNAAEILELKKLLIALRGEEDFSILLLEHDMSLATVVADHVIVLDRGASIADGTSEQIRAKPAVLRAYLGSPPGSEVVPSVSIAC
jgi:branched-chain amino acid transport system ATP-binding protein